MESPAFYRAAFARRNDPLLLEEPFQRFMDREGYVRLWQVYLDDIPMEGMDPARPETCEDWLAQASLNQLYTLLSKAHRQITHWWERPVAEYSPFFLRLLDQIEAMEARRPTVGQLWESGCAQVPQEPGVYFLWAPWGMEPSFREDFFAPAKYPERYPPYPARALEDKYRRLGQPRLLYVGKADGRRGLRQRLRQYLRHGQGLTGNHGGGRAVWQIEDCQRLCCSWEVCPDPEARERALLSALKVGGDYPLANWRG